MYLAIRARIWITALAASAMISIVSTASAQEISDSHMKAARQAINALTATRQYDDILPRVATAMKQDLTQKNPDMDQVISRLVDEEALAIASRRGDLEREVATIYAKIFSEQQLLDIAEFYNSSSGKKLLEDSGLVLRQVQEAAGIWQRGIVRDLDLSVGTKLQEIIDANAKESSPDEGETTEQVNQ